MGYKRMKKRKMLFDKKSKFGKWLRNFHREKLEQWKQRDKQFMEVVLFGNPTPEYSFDQNTGVITLKGDDAERMKWFESPNAEGYLDM